MSIVQWQWKYKALGRYKIEFNLKDTHRIYSLQIIDAFPKPWKDIILKDRGNAKNLVVFEHHIVRKS